MADNKEKGFFSEFKKFIMRGNVLDMAVGVIVGAAFNAIVSSLVSDIITPLIGLIFSTESLKTVVIKLGPAEVLIGNFLSAVINFAITAFVLFSVVRAVNKLRDMGKKKEEPASEPEKPAEPEPTKEEILLAEIRDLLKK